MTTLQEKIAVMQAYADGKAIEMRAAMPMARWEPSPSPSWNWASLEYRVAEDPLEKAMKIYEQGKYPEDSPSVVDRTISQWSSQTRDNVKRGLEAVIAAVKRGEL